MTKGERRLRQEAKKRLIAEGVIPPPKKRLNRKKYIDQAWEEYNAQHATMLNYFAAYQYLIRAIALMSGHRDRNTLNPSLEAVGAAKVLKLATALRTINDEEKNRDEAEYKIRT